MPSDPERPIVLVSVPNEIEAAAILGALGDVGIEGHAVGGYTAGFRAEAPGMVQIVVKQADFERARETLEALRNP